MMTVPAKNTCNGSGFFDKKTYSSDPLKDNTMYLTTQPIETRKKGFGSKDAKRRDEFMSHIRTEQYRETLETELRLHEKQRRVREELGVQESPILEQSKHTFPQGLVETKFLYDIGRSQVTEFDQKSHRDRFYTIRSNESTHKRNNGPFMLTSEMIGLGAEDVVGNRPNPKNASTKQFYDHSHLHVGNA